MAMSVSHTRWGARAQSLSGLALTSRIKLHTDERARAWFCQVRGNFQNSPPGAGGVSQTCRTEAG